MTQSKLPHVTLDELIAVNDEIRALVGAGVPLGAGLLDTSRDVGGRLGRITGALAERIDAGASLSEALAAEGDRVPPLYRAIVEAGIRSGRLASALEGIATSARRLADLRRMLGMALIYPLIVLLVAYAAFILFVVQIVPGIKTFVIDGQLPVMWIIELLAVAGETVAYWGPVVPCLLLLLGYWWLWSRGADRWTSPSATTGMRWIPWVGAAATSGRHAAMTEVLALLVDHQVPLPEGLRLAGHASGGRRLVQETERLAQAAERGEPLFRPGKKSLVVPPVLRWLMSSGQRGDTLGRSLHSVARTYRRRAARQVDAANLYLPALLTVVLGGGAALLLALVLFLPLVEMLTGIVGR